MMSDLVEGKSIAEIRRLTDEFKHMLTDPEAHVPEDLGDLEALQGVGEVRRAREVRDARLAHARRRHRAAREGRRRRHSRRGVAARGTVGRSLLTSTEGSTKGNLQCRSPSADSTTRSSTCSDLDRSVDFYRRAFGFEEIAREGGMMAFMRAAGRRTTTTSG